MPRRTKGVAKTSGGTNQRIRCTDGIIDYHGVALVERGQVLHHNASNGGRHCCCRHCGQSRAGQRCAAGLHDHLAVVLTGGEDLVGLRVAPEQKVPSCSTGTVQALVQPCKRAARPATAGPQATTSKQAWQVCLRMRCSAHLPWPSVRHPQTASCKSPGTPTRCCTAPVCCTAGYPPH